MPVLLDNSAMNTINIIRIGAVFSVEHECSKIETCCHQYENKVPSVWHPSSDKATKSSNYLTEDGPSATGLWCVWLLVLFAALMPLQLCDRGTNSIPGNTNPTCGVLWLMVFSFLNYFE